MTTRFADDTGWTVDEITLSGTPRPSRPGDPPQHYGQRRYLKAHRPGITWHCASVEELAELSAREGIGTLRPVPTHAVLDTRDGEFTTGDESGPFGREGAIEYAAAKGAGRHRVYVLAEVSDERLRESN